jgi:hypothetical protein
MIQLNGSPEQIAYFHNGGYVVHKIPYGKSRISAWFDKDGNIVDAEALRGHRSISLLEGGPAWHWAKERGNHIAKLTKELQHTNA